MFCYHGNSLGQIVATESCELQDKKTSVHFVTTVRYSVSAFVNTLKSHLN